MTSRGSASLPVVTAGLFGAASYRAKLVITIPISVVCLFWVKMRNTRCEQMFSAVPSNSDIARCIPRGNDVRGDAIRPRSGRGVLWLLPPSVRRGSCGLLPAPTRSQSAAAGSMATRRPVVQCVSTRTRSQRTQVVWDVAELPDHLGIIENAGGRITGATECDGADMILLAR